MKIGAIAESLKKPRLEAIKEYGKMGIQGVQMYCGKEFVDFSYFYPL